MECSGPHDSRELLQSPKNGQAKGQKAAHRLSQSFRLGKAWFEQFVD
jgi:serine/threonine-protein kinase ULK4